VLSESKPLFCLTDKSIARLFFRDKVLEISFLILLMEGFLLDEWVAEVILFLSVVIASRNPFTAL
jgi:hypothetical protein